MQTSIAEIIGREILDSRGNPTVEVDVRLEGGALGRAAVPSGASTGEHEAWELRDGNTKRYGAEVFHELKRVLRERGLSTAVGDEGGFAPALSSAKDALESIAQAVERAGYKLGEQIFIALDAASSEFYDRAQNLYVFKKSDGSKRTAEELVEYYAQLCAKFPIISIEDGCAENDWTGWRKLTQRLGEKIQLVGDDLFVTNVEFLRKGIDEHVANSILIKVNQIGTLSETLDAIN